ncbi:hypothetical protein [uncultured Aquimarina sp.]|uniref:hypothetical protein n=1 Tax=uncultured Aquimarina sp. TaxID=575652 RepID=UPI002625EF64|nr:hypothetical protein [uncultured Aquimarina sp.]
MEIEDLTEDEIKIIDKIFHHKYENQGTKYQDSWYLKEYNIDEVNFEYLYNFLCEYGSKLQLIKVKEYKTGIKTIVNFEKVACEKFISKGAFKEHFKSLKKEIQAEQEHKQNTRELTKKDNKLKNPSFWIPTLIAIISFILAIIPYFKDDEKHNDQLELITKEQVLIISDSISNLSTKRLDSILDKTTNELNFLKDSLKKSSRNLKGKK